jgi:hypothetical protein
MTSAQTSRIQDALQAPIRPVDCCMQELLGPSTHHVGISIAVVVRRPESRVDRAGLAASSQAGSTGAFRRLTAELTVCLLLLAVRAAAQHCACRARFGHRKIAMTGRSRVLSRAVSKKGRQLTRSAARSSSQGPRRTASAQGITPHNTLPIRKPLADAPSHWPRLGM